MLFALIKLTIMEKKLFLLDAMALIYRAYYAMQRSPRFTSKGINTSAILGFTNTLYEIIKNEKPTHLAVSFDTGGPTLRHAEFQDYKANREATPDEIITSIPYIKRILEGFNIPIISMEGYEADDIIGTLSKRAEIEGFEVYMMTSDKDYGQLVSENIFMYKPGKFGQKAEVVGVKEICEKYNIAQPEELIDILGLWGDASDNIPGVPTIGEVKAKKLIGQFHSIENIYAHIDEVDNAKLRQTLIDNQDIAMLSKNLATIMLDVPIEVNFDDMKIGKFNIEKLKLIFSELEFKALSQRIFNDIAPQASSAPDLFTPQVNLPQPETTTAFRRFQDIHHNLVKINSLAELSPIANTQTLFFEWIILNQKIGGFAFATESSAIYYHLLEKEHEYFREILPAIFGKERTLVTYQVKQTHKYLKILKINSLASFFDLQIAHYLIQPENAHNLENLSEGYLQYELLPNSKEATIEHSTQITCEKIEIFRELYPIFEKEMQKVKIDALFRDLEMPLSEVLAEMELTGVRVDPEELTKNSQRIENYIRNLEEQIYELAGEKFNVGSPKQLGEILFGKMQIIENAKLTKSKQYQTGEEILVKLINKHPIISLILEWRTLSKLKSTYIDALPLLINAQTGRIHTTFQQTVTSTGRLSSTNPNLQNIPIRTEQGREVRKAFVASTSDALIMAADYSQVELRIAASISKDENMISAFRGHEDIHTATAALVYKVPAAEVTSEQRRHAKTVNFGILYGISAFGLADRLHISQAEARALIENYNQSFPKIRQFMNQLMEDARANGYVETLLGRRRYIRDIDSSNGLLRKAAERNAINAPIQGTAADLIKIAMINIHREFKKRNLKSKMILQVHDELVFEVYKDEMSEVQDIVKNLMENAMHLEVNLEVSMNFGNSWYEAH
mgnify:FL=1